MADFKVHLSNKAPWQQLQPDGKMGILQTKMDELIPGDPLSVQERFLKLEHPLSDIDQSVSRKYVRRMFIFDFPDLSQGRKNDTAIALRRGLEVAFKHYPFLTGTVGPGRDLIRNDVVQLRYGDTPDLRAVTTDIFKIRTHPRDEFGNSYRQLCVKRMPVSHLSKEKYCAAPEFKNSDWRPAFTLQANFLEDINGGGLILCFAFQQSIADGTSIKLFLDKFAAGCRGDIGPQDEITEYQAKTLEYMIPGVRQFVPSMITPEWDFDIEQMPLKGPVTTGIFTMSAATIERLRNDCTVSLKATDPRFNENSFLSQTDCISALFWISILRSRCKRIANTPRHHNLNLSHFSTAVDARRYLPGPGADAFFGNMFTTAALRRPIGNFFQPTSDDHELPKITTALIATCAYHIRHALKGITPSSLGGRVAVLGELAHPLDATLAATKASKSETTGVRIDSLVAYGADLDFGIPGTGTGAGSENDGSPRFVRKPWLTTEGMVNILPRRKGTKGGADWEFLVCGRPNEMRNLVNELQQWTTFYVDDTNPSGPHSAEVEMERLRDHIYEEEVILEEQERLRREGLGETGRGEEQDDLDAEGEED
ncbi:uncharacterized protein BCR38DRAFT_412791 [Pseudomassariella vexata]|uniref:Uncharacterized protein n=1 Tax=Pseudomassariella vexata TaxID=1141098 RepID=A0A1Y2DIL2_9PEZI|nr:uncharacterized protein BCR38DRAFT_412791 [Pseudomassariella vexata]ORY59072.1 hypothetical protein BCR38DRAFT_412791 [Pseudomassariella vexata]